MKIIARLLIALTICISISSCGAPKYRAKYWKGGYSEIKIAEDGYSVRFQGNGYTSKEKAVDYCLLRCAELTNNSGYSYFIIFKNSEDNLMMHKSAWASVHNTIKLFHEKPNQNDVYEAKYIISSIKGKYHLK